MPRHLAAKELATILALIFFRVVQRILTIQQRGLPFRAVGSLVRYISFSRLHVER